MSASDTVLMVIDVQVDFLPGGPLAVKDGDAVIAPINRMMPRFSNIIAAQDWHPADHFSFAANHDGKAPFDVVESSYGPQTLWPVHAVQGTPGAAFHPDLDLSRAELIVRKGFRRDIDSYSAFFENDRTTPTGLAGYLRERGFKRIVITGLATDYCVGFSTLDAAKLGFETHLALDACRGIDIDGSIAKMLGQMTELGVTITHSEAV
jgi:nicotinamidase/pyrazinamidase